MPQTSASFQDLQGRLAAIEALLAQSRRQLSETQQLTGVGSWEWDIAAGSVWWSDELFRIYGREPGELTPTYETFLEHVHPDDRASVDERNRRAFADHEPFEDVKRVRRADGEEILMRTRGEVICDERGKPLRMVGICDDVTAERRAAERADAEVLAVSLLEARERLVHVGTLIEAGQPDRAAAAIAETRRALTRLADSVLGSRGAADRIDAPA